MMMMKMWNIPGIKPVSCRNLRSRGFHRRVQCAPCNGVEEEEYTVQLYKTIIMRQCVFGGRRHIPWANSWRSDSCETTNLCSGRDVNLFTKKNREDDKWNSSHRKKTKPCPQCYFTSAFFSQFSPLPLSAGLNTLFEEAGRRSERSHFECVTLYQTLQWWHLAPKLRWQDHPHFFVTP